MSLEDKEIQIDSLEDLYRCINLASLLELSGWPKPGNVHRTKNFDSTRFEHFLAGISAIQPNFRDFCIRIYESSQDLNDNLSYVKLGVFFKEAVKEMMEWQRGGNVILGHILLLAPLTAAAVLCLKFKKINFHGFKAVLNRIISEARVNDTIALYEAIRFCNPGGLGTIEKYDLNDENSMEQIKHDKITLKQIFTLSQEYDLISYEYANGFPIILKEGLPFFLRCFEKNEDINIATVNTFLKILSEHLDTLIIRKSGREIAQQVLAQAKEITEAGGISTEKGLELTRQLDAQLQLKKGKANPGSTADLVSGVLFCALLLGVRF